MRYCISIWMEKQAENMWNLIDEIKIVCDVLEYFSPRNTILHHIMSAKGT